ncbi:MAG TPA: lipid-binding SYLF domain-containing protein [Candidatus Acidoferrales bacterium]|nr:lipid-binding SYLF domain-containing protein [Candidatus Acidoferrales bacterium]
MKSTGVLAVLILSTAVLQAGESAPSRLTEAAEVFGEIMGTPDKGIPQDLLEKAQCVGIVPGLKKGAFLVGGEFGKGFVQCRKPGGAGWSAPAAVRVEGGSVGLQIGGSSTDVVMLVMNQRGMDKLMTDKFTLGADASVAAGPVGRTANAKTDAYMTAEILAWSRSKGLFAGISLSGATLRNDLDGNKELYGSRLTNKEVLAGDRPAPEAAKKLIEELDKYSMRKSN